MRLIGWLNQALVNSAPDFSPNSDVSHEPEPSPVLSMLAEALDMKTAGVAAASVLVFWAGLNLYNRLEEKSEGEDVVSEFYSTPIELLSPAKRQSVLQDVGIIAHIDGKDFVRVDGNISPSETIQAVIDDPSYKTAAKQKILLHTLSGILSQSAECGQDVLSSPAL